MALPLKESYSRVVIAAVPTLEELAQAAVEGDREAARSLVERILPKTRNLIRFLVHGDRFVDDLTQDALVAVVRGLPTWRGEGSVQAWVNRVTVRATFASLRKLRSQEPVWPESPELVDVSQAQPEAYIQRRRVAALLDLIPEKQRTVVVLHHVLGMSAREVAEELDVPKETVRSRLRLGMTRLRKLAREDALREVAS